MNRSPRTKVLTAATINALRFTGKPERHWDLQCPGLHVVTRARAKYFYWAFKLHGKSDTLALGQYGDRPDQVTLAQARTAAIAARALVLANKHPRTMKREELRATMKAAANTFNAAAELWYAVKQGTEDAPRGLSDHYMGQLKTALDRDVAPYIGALPMQEIDTADCLACIMRHADTPSWARLVRFVIFSVFKHANKYLGLKYNPTLSLMDNDTIGEKGDIVKPLPTPNAHIKGHEISEFLATVDAAQPTVHGRNPVETLHVRKLGIKLLMLTLVRPNELAGAAWCEFDMETRLWNIPAERMKKKRPHIVPLSRQALAILAELRTLSGASAYVFPDRDLRKRSGDVPIWPAVFSKFIRKIGFGGRLTAHGLRGTASTALNEWLVLVEGVKRRRWEADWVEVQLAHVPGGVRARYNHASYMESRAEMMQAYADMVMAPPAPATTALPLPSNVVPLRLAA